MGPAAARSLHCPQLFRKIGSSSGQPNWLEGIFLSSHLGDHACQLVVVTD